jgi:hypothetical protein
MKDIQQNTMCAPVLEEIDLAETASVLHNIRNHVIPHVIGITDTERRHLIDAVSNRFAQLNHAAVGPQKARW